MLALPGLTPAAAAQPGAPAPWRGPRVKMGIYQGVPTKVGTEWEGAYLGKGSWWEGEIRLRKKGGGDRGAHYSSW